MVNDTLCLNENYSTTRLLTKEKPEIINSPEDKFETVLFLPEGEGRKGEGGLRTQGYFKKSFEDKPLISVITVVFNGEKFLEETIQSVINQTYDNVEYIIIDGGSSDGTLDIIKKYEDKIDYWVCERDSGIYDAMNKGIDLASGNWINFMNAGDIFAGDSVLKFLKLSRYSNYNMVYGKKITKDKVYDVLPVESLEDGVIMACHQSMFFNKKNIKENLNYDTKYKIYGDYELVNRLYLINKNKLKYIDVIVANFLGDGVSSKISWQKRKDKMLIMLDHYGIRLTFKKYISRLLNKNA